MHRDQSRPFGLGQHFALTARGMEQLQAPSPSPRPAQGSTTPDQGQARVRSEAGNIFGKSVRGERWHVRSHRVAMASLPIHPLSQHPAELPAFRGRLMVPVALGSSPKTHFHPDPLEPRPPPHHAATFWPTHEVLLLLTHCFHVSGPSLGQDFLRFNRETPTCLAKLPVEPRRKANAPFLPGDHTCRSGRAFGYHMHRRC